MLDSVQTLLEPVYKLTLNGFTGTIFGYLRSALMIC